MASDIDVDAAIAAAAEDAAVVTIPQASVGAKADGVASTAAGRAKPHSGAKIKTMSQAEILARDYGKYDPMTAIKAAKVTGGLHFSNELSGLFIKPTFSSAAAGGNLLTALQRDTALTVANILATALFALISLYVLALAGMALRANLVSNDTTVAMAWSMAIGYGIVVCVRIFHAATGTPLTDKLKGAIAALRTTLEQALSTRRVGAGGPAPPVTIRAVTHAPTDWGYFSIMVSGILAICMGGIMVAQNAAQAVDSGRSTAGVVILMGGAMLMNWGMSGMERSMQRINRALKAVVDGLVHNVMELEPEGVTMTESTIVTLEAIDAEMGNNGN